MNSKRAIVYFLVNILIFISLTIASVALMWKNELTFLGFVLFHLTSLYFVKYKNNFNKFSISIQLFTKIVLISFIVGVSITINSYLALIGLLSLVVNFFWILKSKIVQSSFSECNWHDLFVLTFIVCVLTMDTLLWQLNVKNEIYIYLSISLSAFIIPGFKWKVAWNA